MLNKTGLKSDLTLSLIELEEADEWTYGHDLAVIKIIQLNLAAALQAMLDISNDLKHPEKIDTLGVICLLAETLDWIADQVEIITKDNNG